VRETIVKDVIVPVPPDDLADRGLTEWERIWTAGSSWRAPEQDYHWIAMTARAYDDIDEFRARVNRDGLIQQGSMGQVIAHPLISEIRKCETLIMKCLATLGFSPSDRARLGLAEVKTASKLQQMMQQAK
jgi:P27 family predicted phage terminase small subunit